MLDSPHLLAKSQRATTCWLRTQALEQLPVHLALLFWASLVSGVGVEGAAVLELEVPRGLPGCWTVASGPLGESTWRGRGWGTQLPDTEVNVTRKTFGHFTALIFQKTWHQTPKERHLHYQTDHSHWNGPHSSGSRTMCYWVLSD